MKIFKTLLLAQLGVASFLVTSSSGRSAPGCDRGVRDGVCYQTCIPGGCTMECANNTKYYHSCSMLCPGNIEQFSIKCRKAKTKVITLANHKGRRAIHCPIKTPSNHTNRGKTCASKSRLVLVLLLIG